MRTRLVTGAVALAAASLALPSSAATTVSIGSVTVSGSSVAVSGTAVFDALTGAANVGGTNTQFANASVADAAGINLTGAAIQPLQDGAGLRFIWNVTGLPAQVPPEGVRYTWAFKIGDTQYQLQAKRSNVASITTAEDPVNHAKQVGKDFFQLRGACVENYVGQPAPQSTAGCYHLAFLNGSFDAAGKRVTVDLPFRTKDQIGRVVAPDFVPGAVIVENQTAGMSITGAFQAVIGNTSTSDFINGWSAYRSAPVVQVATGSAGDDPASLEYTTVKLDGSSFSGTAPLVEGADTVFVAACQATTCDYAQRAL